MPTSRITPRILSLQASERGIIILVFTLIATLGIFNGGSVAIVALAGSVLLAVTAVLTGVSSGGFSLRAFPVPARIPTRFVFVFLALSACLAPWAMNPSAAWGQTAEFASIVLPLLLWSLPNLIQTTASLSFWRFWPWILALGLAAMVFEYGYDGWLICTLKGESLFTERLQAKYNRGISYGMILLWPALALACHQRPRPHLQRFLLCLALVMFAGLLVVLTHSRTVQVSMPPALMVAFLGAWIPRTVAALLAVGTVLSASLPFLIPYAFTHLPTWIARLPPSWQTRVEIWDYMGMRIREDWLTGWGAGSRALVPMDSPNAPLYQFMTAGPAGHAHNLWIQSQLELGLGGLALVLIAVLAVLRQAVTLPPPLRAYALGAWMTSMGLLMVAYDVWSDSLLSVLALTAFLFAVITKIPLHAIASTHGDKDQTFL